MIKFLTILSIFIVLLNEIDAKSLDRPSKVSQRDGYVPTKDRTMRKPTPTDGYVCDDDGFCGLDGDVRQKHQIVQQVLVANGSF